MIDSEFKIDVHLENLKGHKGIGQDVKKHFKLTDDKERGDKMPLHSTILTGCSFEAKEKAEDTFKRILDVLKSKPFEDLAVKANTWTE